MRYLEEHYIHELTLETILNILKYDAWKVNNQSVTSACTNDNNLETPNEEWLAIGENTAGINAFSDIPFNNEVTQIVDIGGGKYDCNRNYMKREKGIDLLVWDPYNRSEVHNMHIKALVADSKIKAATSMSVLNVIPEIEVRLAHIVTLKEVLMIDGRAYFKIWSGEKPLQGDLLTFSDFSFISSELLCRAISARDRSCFWKRKCCN